MIFDKKKFSDLLRKAIGNRSITSFAEESKVARPHISKYLNQRYETSPGQGTLEKFASAARNGVTLDDFIEAAFEYEDDIISSYSLPSMEEDYSEIYDYGTSVIKLMESDTPVTVTKVEPTYIKVPVLPYVDLEHYSKYLEQSHNTNEDDETLDYRYITRDEVTDLNSCFFAIVNDNSMAQYLIDDYLLIDTFIKPIDNDDVLIIYNNEPYIRTFRKINKYNIYLTDKVEYDSFCFINPDLNDSEQVQVIGVVVQHISKKRKKCDLI